MARGPKLAADRLEQRSAEGRDEVDRLGRGQRQPPPGADEQVVGRRRDEDRAGAEPVAVVGLADRQGALCWPRISASRLGRLGSRCCTTTTAAGKSAGRCESTAVSALSPPAEATTNTAPVTV